MEIIVLFDERDRLPLTDALSKKEVFVDIEDQLISLERKITERKGKVKNWEKLVTKDILESILEKIKTTAFDQVLS